MDPVDLTRVRTRSLSSRSNKVRIAEFARPVDPAGSLSDFLDGLSDLLAVKTLRGLATAIVEARRRQRPVLWALGAHVVKAGLSPVLIRLMERGYVQGLALNGATAIHDWEIAAIGATSEEVSEGIADGSFGMAMETGEALNGAAARAREQDRGFGEVLGAEILENGLPHAELSLVAEAAKRKIPVTIHVSIGSDIVHQHPGADGASIGAASLTDFKRLAALVGELEDGVWLNCGSAVVLPEVFLKALSVARNLGHPVQRFTTANLDMLRNYRVDENVLRRPTAGGGRSFNLIGHHEINLPLLAAAIETEARR